MVQSTIQIKVILCSVLFGDFSECSELKLDHSWESRRRWSFDLRVLKQRRTFAIFFANITRHSVLDSKLNNLLIYDSWGLDDVRTGQAAWEAIYRQNWGVIWGRVPVIWSATVILEWTMSLDSVLNLSVPTGALLLFVFQKVLWYRTEHEYFLQNKVHEHCENKSLQWSTLFFVYISGIGLCVSVRHHFEDDHYFCS